MKPEPKSKQQFRPKVVLALVGVGLIGLLVVATAAKFLWHRYQVAQNNGVWCVRFFPDGTQKTLYGASDCNLPEEDEQNP